MGNHGSKAEFKTQNFKRARHTTKATFSKGRIFLTRFFNKDRRTKNFIQKRPELDRQRHLPHHGGPEVKAVNNTHTTTQKFQALDRFSN